MTPTSAMIFAAGFGTRMGNVTKTTPKSMIPVNGQPMIDYPINWARQAGIQNIVVNTHYLHDQIEPHLAARDVRISRETPQILETGGGLRAALPLLGDGPVVTLNSDAMLRGPNPVKLLIEHWQHGMMGLLLLVPKSHALTTRERADFSLKKGKIDRIGDYFYIGAQVIDPYRLAEIAEDSFSLNSYWNLLAEDAPLDGLIYPGTWCDVGDQSGLAKAERMLRDI